MTQIKITLGAVTASAALRLAESRGTTVPALVHDLIREKALLEYARPHTRAVVDGQAKPNTAEG